VLDLHDNHAVEDQSSAALTGFAILSDSTQPEALEYADAAVTSAVKLPLLQVPQTCHAQWAVSGKLGLHCCAPCLRRFALLPRHLHDLPPACHLHMLSTRPAIGVLKLGSQMHNHAHIPIQQQALQLTQTFAFMCISTSVRKIPDNVRCCAGFHDMPEAPSKHHTWFNSCSLACHKGDLAARSPYQQLQLYQNIASIMLIETHRE
jgi:hypothetical protein